MGIREILDIIKDSNPLKKENREAKKLKLNEDQKKKCCTLIHGASVSAAAIAGGVAQIPLADNVALISIQVPMIIALAKVFGHNISGEIANGIIKSAAASFIGRGVTQVLWGWIPLAGNAINVTTAAGLTEAIGWLAVKEFCKPEDSDGNSNHDSGGSQGSGENEKSPESTEEKPPESIEQDAPEDDEIDLDELFRNS